MLSTTTSSGSIFNSGFVPEREELVYTFVYTSVFAVSVRPAPTSNAHVFATVGGVDVSTLLILMGKPISFNNPAVKPVM